jgi:predicted O-methyltransferase YrrM
MFEDINYISDVVPKLDGWCTVEKALKLYHAAASTDKPLCVELGVFAGRSLLPIALACKSKGGKCYGIDAWSKDACLEGENAPENADWWSKIDFDHFYNYTKKVIEDAKATDNCIILRNKSSDVVNIFEDMSIDLLHQDSNHSEVTTVEEVNRWYNKVKVGGLWAFDDTDWSTTKAAQDLLIQKGYAVISENDGKWRLFKRVK